MHFWIVVRFYDDPTGQWAGTQHFGQLSDHKLRKGH